MDLEEIDFVWPRCVLRHLHKIIHFSDYIATCTHTHVTRKHGDVLMQDSFLFPWRVRRVPPGPDPREQSEMLNVHIPIL